MLVSRCILKFPFMDNDGFAESVQYSGVQYVQEAPPVNTPAEFSGLGITGEFTEGSILTADYQITDANGLVVLQMCLVLR